MARDRKRAERAAKTRRMWLREDRPDLVCPRCKGFIPNNDRPGAYPGALSRRDNETYICSLCGQFEALEDAGLVPSWRGERYWTGEQS